MEQIRQLELSTKLLLQNYCNIIDRVLEADKPIDNSEGKQMAMSLQKRYDEIIGLFDTLPLYDERTLEEYQREVLDRHR